MKYLLEYTNFEGEKTTLIKELTGEESWENDLDETLIIISNFLRATGHKFKYLEAVKDDKLDVKVLKDCVDFRGNCNKEETK